MEYGLRLCCIRQKGKGCLRCMPRKLLVRLLRHSPHPYESLSLFRGHVQVVSKSIISVHPCILLQHSWGSIWHQRCQGIWRLWKSGSCQLWPHHRAYYRAACTKWGVHSHFTAVCPSGSCCSSLLVTPSSWPLPSSASLSFHQWGFSHLITSMISYLFLDIYSR